jgi:hypothetical protein
MSHRQELIDELLRAFPRRTFTGIAAPHDCLECSIIRDALAGLSWAEVPSTFLREHCGDLPLLSPEAYVTFLPAWLREAIANPEGEVPSSLRVVLRDTENTAPFSREQSQLIVKVAEWFSENDGFGTDDPVNIESLAKIRAVWGKHVV